MKATEIYGEYLSGDDVKAGQDLHLTITAAAPDTLAREGEQGKRRIILSFKEIPQRLALNKENAEVIIGALGDETDDWVGQSLTLWNDPEVRFKGKKTGGIRIRPFKNVPQQA